MQRESFNDGWRVRPRVNPFAEMFSPGTGADWADVTLPHDAMLTAGRDPGNEHALGYFAGGEWQYEKRFTPPEGWRGKRVLLEFEAVYRSAVVWVNGTQAGHRPYGYSQFTVDLGAHLRYGDGNVVHVDCTAREDSRWYSGAGIHRPVHLVVAEPVHVPLDGVVVTTPTVDAHGALVAVATTVVNDSMLTAAATLTTEITDANGGGGRARRRAAHGRAARRRHHAAAPLRPRRRAVGVSTGRTSTPAPPLSRPTVASSTPRPPPSVCAPSRSTPCTACASTASR